MSASYLYYYFDKDGALKEQKRKLEQQQRETISLTKINIFREAGAEVRRLENEINDLQLQLQVREGVIPQEQLVLRITELEKLKTKYEDELNNYENKMREAEARRKQQEELIKINKEEAEKKKKEGKKGSPPPKKIIEPKKEKEEIIETKEEKKIKTKEVIKRFTELSSEQFVAIFEDRDNKTIILFKNLDDFFYIFSGPKFTISEDKKMITYKNEGGGENLPSTYPNSVFYNKEFLKIDKIPGYNPEKIYGIGIQFFHPPTKERKVYLGFSQKGFAAPQITNIKHQKYINLSSWKILTKIYEDWKIIII